MPGQSEKRSQTDIALKMQLIPKRLCRIIFNAPTKLGSRESAVVCENLVGSTLYSAKATMTDTTARRVFIQDFAAALNRRQLINNIDVEQFKDIGYEYMESE